MKDKEQKNNSSDAVDTGKVLTPDELNLETDAEKTVEQEKSHPKTENTESIDKSKEYLEMAQRIQAEFDNFRKRNLEIANNSRQDGIAFAVETLLPMLDSIYSAKRQLKDDELSKSIDLIYRQTLDCFSKLGVKKIDAIGKPFNPEIHNAIMAEHKDGVEPDIVLDEFQEGFELCGKIIRHSVVKVSK